MKSIERSKVIRRLSRLVSSTLNNDCVKQGRSGEQNPADILNISIVELAKNHEYDQILSVLRNQDVDIRKWLNIDNGSSKSQLHSILMYNPSVELIDLIIQRMIECNNHLEHKGYAPEIELDEEGKTPLHVAVEHGCSIDIIHRLLKGKYKYKPVFMQDSTSRYPLHWACTYPQRVDLSLSSRNILQSMYRRSSSSVGPLVTSDDNSFKVIKLLLKIHPVAATAPDQYGRTPLGLAAQYGLTDEFIRVLKRTRTTSICSVSKESTKTAKTVTSASFRTQGISISDVSKVPNNITIKPITDEYGDKKKQDIKLQSIPSEIKTRPEDDADDDLSTVGSQGVSYVFSYSPIKYKSKAGKDLILF